ncbi:hypothetical protein PROPEN_00843 [Proteus penneri ATCC 35198]|nr:hypothetical protein PROPEN_00843 [Proteus penneri ATCC 35198]
MKESIIKSLLLYSLFVDITDKITKIDHIAPAATLGSFVNNLAPPAGFYIWANK